MLAAVRALAEDAPDELGLALAMVPAPPAPFIPAERVGRPHVVVMFVWSGDPADGPRAMAAVRSVGTPRSSLAAASSASPRNHAVPAPRPSSLAPIANRS